MPSFNRILKIFSRIRFKEKQAEVKRRSQEIAMREEEEQVSSQLSQLSV